MSKLTPIQTWRKLCRDGVKRSGLVDKWIREVECRGKDWVKAGDRLYTNGYGRAPHSHEVQAEEDLSRVSDKDLLQRAIDALGRSGLTHDQIKARLATMKDSVGEPTPTEH